MKKCSHKRSLQVSLLTLLLIVNARAQPIPLTQLAQQASIYLNCDGGVLPTGAHWSGDLVPGKWGKAILCESKLQNLVADANFSKGWDDWIKIGAPQIKEQLEDASKSTFIECTPGNVVRQPILQLPTRSAVYCLSFYARAASEGARPLAAVRIGGRDITLDEKQSRSLGTSWERRWLVFTSDNSPVLGEHKATASRSTSATITVGASVGIVQIDRMQLEEGGFPTSFTSSNRGNSMLTITGLDGRLDPSQGTVAMWIFPDWSPGEYGRSTFFDWSNSGKPTWQYDTLNFNHSYKGAWGAGFLVHAGDDAGFAIHPLTSDPDWQGHTWHHIAFTWKLLPNKISHIDIYLDGELVKTYESEKKLGTRVPGESIAFGGGDGTYANAALDEVAVFTKVLSSDDIKTLAQAKTAMK